MAYEAPYEFAVFFDPTYQTRGIFWKEAGDPGFGKIEGTAPGGYGGYTNEQVAQDPRWTRYAAVPVTVLDDLLGQISDISELVDSELTSE